MTQQKIITDKAPHISIADCQGDLVIRSWGETAVSCKGDNFELNEGESSLSVSSSGDLKLVVPEQSNLSIVNVSGDLVIKYVSGSISINEAHRDAVLVGTGSVKINIIHSDITAKNIDGDINAETIHGDASFRNLNHVNLGIIYGDMSIRNANGSVNIQEATGDISLRTVNGDVHVQNGRRDINLRNLGGKTVVENIQGDIRLTGGLSADSHSFQAERDIIVRWPFNAPLNLTASAPRIKNRLVLENASEADGTLTGNMGDGETNVRLEANGRIILKDTQIVDPRWEGDLHEGGDFDFTLELEGLGSRISSQLLDQFAQISTDFESKFGAEFSQRISEKISRKAEQAAAKAEKAAKRAAARAEKASQRARNRAEYTVRRSPGRPPAAPKPPSATSKPKQASGEEQLKILKMVEQGIITPQEAATLLEALNN